MSKRHYMEPEPMIIPSFGSRSLFSARRLIVFKEHRRHVWRLRLKRGAISERFSPKALPALTTFGGSIFGTCWGFGTIGFAADSGFRTLKISLMNFKRKTPGRGLTQRSGPERVCCRDCRDPVCRCRSWSCHRRRFRNQRSRHRISWTVPPSRPRCIASPWWTWLNMDGMYSTLSTYIFQLRLKRLSTIEFIKIIRKARWSNEDPNSKSQK